MGFECRQNATVSDRRPLGSGGSAHESIGVLEHIPGIVGATDALGTCIGIRAVPLRRRSNAAHCGDSGLVTLNALTSHGMMTWPKITGSGHTLTCRPRWPPCGLIQASLGTSPFIQQ